MISLFDFFKSVFRHRKLSRVSPPLVGVVLLSVVVSIIFFPIRSFAVSFSLAVNRSVNYSGDASGYYVYSSYQGLTFTSEQVGKYWYIDTISLDLTSCNLTSAQKGTCEVVISHGGVDYVLPATRISGQIAYFVTSTNPLTIPITDVGAVFRFRFYNYSDYASNGSVTVTLNDSISDESGSTHDAVVDSIQAGNSQDKQFHDEDRADATQAGNDMAGFATDLENVKNRWAILWYPIEFTNTIFGAFQGTSSAAYSSRYGNITGYTYDDEQGLLVPVYSLSRAAASEGGGTTITFPEYTLPVLNVKLWDSYSYDLSDLKDQFSVIFDLLYVAIGILETYWFVGFLRDKYEEVFG